MINTIFTLENKMWESAMNGDKTSFQNFLTSRKEKKIMKKLKCKIYCTVVCAVLPLAFCGCTSTAGMPESSLAENNESTAVSESETDKVTEMNTPTADTASETETEADSIVKTEADTEIETTSEILSPSSNSITEAEIRNLFEENLYCLNSVFMSDHLEYSGDAVIDEHIYKVSDSRFGSYADFENYIRSVYCTSEADRLLYNYPYENTPVYTDVDGMLCIDSNYAHVKAYFVDWTDAEIVVNAADECRCEFSVKGYIDEPSDIPAREEYIANGAVVYDNDKWVLEKIIY